MNVLALNCGSTSTKFAVVHSTNGHEHVSGVVQPLGEAQATLEFSHEGRSEERSVAGGDTDAALRAV